MPSSPQLTSTRKGKKTANKKSARTPATITKQRKRTLVVESADEAEATAAPQLQEDQYDIAAEAPQISKEAEKVADAVDTKTPHRRVVGHVITFPKSLAPLGIMQSEEPLSSMTLTTQMQVPVTSPAAQAARENATPVASTVTLNSPTASCPPPPCPAPSPPCDAPAPLTPPQEEHTSADPPEASVTTPERPRAKIAG